jgi:OOP family OmpA-OmpF porin
MRLLLSLMFLVLLLTSSQAWAEAESRGPNFTLMASYVDPDSARNVDSTMGFQMGIGYRFNNRWNADVYSQFANLSGPVSEDQAAFGVDLQRFFRRPAHRFNPFVFFGGGVMQTEIEGAGKESGGMYDFGIGFTASVVRDGPFAIRGEYRYRVDSVVASGSPDYILSLGFTMSFLGEKPVVDPDSDGDGVPDSRDECPGTPMGLEVDSRGCRLDSDGDGVTDEIDRCPNTPPGSVVDATGCIPDTDGDGVVDPRDDCPNTPLGAPVDFRGCEIKTIIRLPGVNFEFDSSDFQLGAERVLDLAVGTLNEYPDLIVEVAGYTDSDGPAAYNLRLSSRRARTVSDYLIAAGIAAERVSARGYGEADPVADNEIDEGRAENRRVVLRIIE